MKADAHKRPVLILGSAPRISLPVARSLHRHGVPVELASFAAEEPRLVSRAIREFHRLPSKDAAPDQFLRALTALIAAKKFDMLIPASDPALAALAQHYEKLSPLLHLACPPPQVVERVLDKAFTLEVAQQCGMDVPFSRSLSSPQQLQGIVSQLHFPVVVKPQARGFKSFKVMYFFSIEELTAALATGRLGEVLVQEYCPGHGVGIEMLIHGGECVAAFQHRRLKEAPITGGVAVMAIAEEPTPDLAQASFDLLRALQWEGVAMVEFRVNPENGRAVLMEVNGRYWGTSSLPFLAGVDFPLYQWQLLHGEPPVVPPNYAVGMRWRWTAGYLARMHAVVTGSSAPVGPRVSRWQELSSVPADLIAPSVRDALWSWSDPVPALADTASAVLEWTKADLTWLLRKVVPQKAVFDLGVYRRLGPKAGPKFLKLRILDSLRLAWSNRRMVPPQARSFLFICHGNIMRSPMAAEMLSRALPSHLEHDVVVRSAGMHARTGREAERRALLVSRELGIPLDAHQAQPVGPEMVAAADAILAMDFANKAELLARFPEAQDRIFLLSTYAEGKQRFREIPDPYFGDLDEVRRCYQTLQTCIHNLVSTLSPETPRTSGPWRKTAIGV